MCQNKIEQKDEKIKTPIVYFFIHIDYILIKINHEGYFMRNITIVANFLSALFMALILIGSYSIGKESSKRIKCFRICVWFCLAGLIFDGLAYLWDGDFNNNIVIGVINYLSYIIVDLLIASYSFYLYVVIKEKEPNFNKAFPIITSSLATLDIIFLTIGSISGQLFTVANGKVTNQLWSNYISIGPLLCFVAILVTLLVKSKKIGVSTTFFLLFYLFMPVIAGILKLFWPEFEVGYVAFSLALMTIYVMIHSRIVAEANVRVAISKELSRKDELTGLKNRRCYDEVLDAEPKGRTIAAIFCDINSLKTVNDTRGHEAGDELIKKTANILSSSFPRADVFRISGDEFVIIVYNLDNFDEKINNFGWAAGSREINMG